MMESLGWMSRYTNEWSVDLDTSLTHLFGYWKSIIEKDDAYLVLKVTREDVARKTLAVDIYSDADHASDFTRRSTGANGALLQGEYGSRALIDYGSKVQPSTARSSGESETTHVGEVCKGLSESPITELEHQLIVKAADKTKTASIVAQRVCFPIQDFVEWMLKDTTLTVKVDTLKLDATVARAISISGQSKAWRS